MIPGFTFTGLTAAAGATKPAAAWTPEQVVEFLLASMAAGDFYILCPDNDVTRDTPLAKQNAIPQKQLDTDIANAASWKAQKQAHQEAFQNAELNLS